MRTEYTSEIATFFAAYPAAEYTAYLAGAVIIGGILARILLPGTRMR